MYKVCSLCTFLYFVILMATCSCWVMTDVDGDYLDLEYGIPEEDLQGISNSDLPQRRFSLIFPGTKWCGAGNVADDYEDLGSERETDMCCRDHDNCPDLILAGETKNNLTNSAFYTRLSCECDEGFRKCLHDANSTTAKRIGVIYFNALGTKCYRKDYPIVKCTMRGGWFKRKCLRYDVDMNEDQIYQWFDVNNY
ncbi:phospholipase A2-like [Bombyx mandarina]|uniref:Phospholipase A2 n=2 Tax=Bombyx mandarina TaxID=7092 RepID=A0A6J2K2X4_BOMMA|nr:phospholipase A2-like [Bombyx mandarina]